MTEFRTSTFSGGGNCVEVEISEHRVVVRDSKLPGGGALVFNLDEWAAFIAGVKAGEFG